VLNKHNRRKTVAVHLAAALTLSALVLGLPTSAIASTPLASTWTPLPAAAQYDLPSTYNRCHARVPDTAAVACVVGDTKSNKTVVLMGDSHAANWIPGLILAANKAHWRLVIYTKTTCPAMPVNVTLTTSLTSKAVPYAECGRWRTNVLAKLAMWNPTVIMVAGSHTTRMIGLNGIVFRTTPAAKLQRDAAWRKATRQLLARLKRDEPKALVLVLHDTPIARQDVVQCVARAEFKKAGTTCSYPVSAALLPSIRAAELAALVANPNARLVDPVHIACTTTRCIPAANGILRYRNAGHLTATFSRTLSPMWVEILKRAELPLTPDPYFYQESLPTS